MKKIQLAMMLLMAVVLAAPVTSWANPSCPMCKGMKGEGNRHISAGGSLDGKVFHKAKFLLKKQEELGLSEEQVSRIKEIKMALKKDLITRKADIEVAGIDIKAALSADKLDAEAVNTLIDKKYELKKQKAKRTVEAYAQLKDVLTAEQRSQIKDMWKAKKSSKHNGSWDKQGHYKHKK